MMPIERIEEKALDGMPVFKGTSDVNDIFELI